MSEQLKGQVAIITGAASGLGLAIAKKLHAEGVRVAMLDLNQDATQAASQEVGENAAAFPADITDEAQVSRCVTQIGQRFGRIDILVNSAGVTGRTNVKSHEVELADFRRVFEVNVVGSSLDFALRATLDVGTPIRTHPAHRLGLRQGGQCRDAGRFGLESCGDWDDQSARQGVRRDRRHS